MSDLDAKSAGAAPDRLLVDIAAYVRSFEIASRSACDAARGCLMDALACCFEALGVPVCAGLLGPVVPGATMAGGARVPGTSYELDPVQAAFNIGAMLGACGAGAAGTGDGHRETPCALGAIVAVADYRARKAIAEGGHPPTVRDVLNAMIKAHEIQDALAREDCLDAMGRVRIASTAVVAAMLGATQEQIVDALSNAWLDGGVPGASRRAPDAGLRSRRAAGDATSRGVRHALLALAGVPGDRPAQSAGSVGGCDQFADAGLLAHGRPLGCGMMENLQVGTVWPDRVMRFEASIAEVFGAKQCERIRALCADAVGLDAMPVHQFVSAFVKN